MGSSTGLPFIIYIGMLQGETHLLLDKLHVPLVIHGIVGPGYKPR